jgi:hypothetical protein
LKPRIILVEPQDDLDEICRKLDELQTDSVALVIPIGAVILQSVISIKILRSNAEKRGKNITLVTRDRQGKAFAARLGIPCVNNLENLEESPIQQNLRKRPEPEEQRQVTKKVPLEPPRNDPREIEEIDEVEKAKKALSLEQKKREILEMLSRPNKVLLFSIAIISILLLLVVTTLAVPGATIYINPHKKVVESTMNVTLTTGPLENATDSWRQYVIRAIPIESVFERAIDFQTASSVFTGQVASGEVVVINRLAEEVSLRPDTRFQNDDGIIFRTNEWVTVQPGAEQTVPVTADERDIYGEYGGARGNISEPQKLFLPGLSEPSRQYVWGEIRTPTSGGLSGYIPLVQEVDLELAEKQITEMIVNDAKNDSEIFVERKNRLEDNDLVLLPGNEFLDLEILEIELPEELIGQNIDSFTVRSRMRVKMIAYSNKEMESILTGALEKAIDPGMELVSVENKGFSPEVLNISDDKSRVKITISARGVEAYVIESKSENGVRFVNEVKEETIGQSVREARQLIENMEEVDTVEIKLWPPFPSRLPRLPENISVRLME